MGIEDQEARWCDWRIDPGIVNDVEGDRRGIAESSQLFVGHGTAMASGSTRWTAQ
jgi:hypothetical protein